MEMALCEQLGKKVKIVSTGTKGTKGTIEIEFYTKEELSDLAKKLTK